MKQSENHLYNHIEDTINQMWKAGLVVRSTNPNTTSGEYHFAAPKHQGSTPEGAPELGPFVTYEQFQTQINQS